MENLMKQNKNEQNGTISTDNYKFTDQELNKQTDNIDIDGIKSEVPKLMRNHLPDSRN